MPTDHPGVQAIARAVEAVTGTRAPLGVAPFVSDANYWFGRGQPCVVFGCGEMGPGAHGVNENYPIADLIQSTKVFAAVSMEWCGVAE